MSVTVPPMDGALKPNSLMQDAEVLLSVIAPDNIARDGESLLFSCGEALMTLDEGTTEPRELNRFDAQITAIAADGKGGYVVGLSNGRVEYGGLLQDLPPIDAQHIGSPTALEFDGSGSLCICNGSQENDPAHWTRDLLDQNASGSVWRFNTMTGQGTCLADGLAWPNGITVLDHIGTLLVSESWKHRLVVISPKYSDKPVVVLDDLPGYPGRIAADTNGYWLTVFAPRGQLIEFVLREDGYRNRMIETVAPEYWVAPSLNSGRSFLEPLQLGAIRTMGTLKPWAPTRSYGLLVHLDDQFQPTNSAHSRSDGTMHGITSCLHWEDKVIVTSKGGDAILSLKLQDILGDE